MFIKSYKKQTLIDQKMLKIYASLHTIIALK
jgi:hypothetical protein